MDTLDIKQQESLKQRLYELLVSDKEHIKNINKEIKGVKEQTKYLLFIESIEEKVDERIRELESVKTSIIEKYWYDKEIMKFLK